MIQDIYTRNPEDPNFRYDVLSHSDPIESILSKIKMILNTRPGEVFGDANFGVGVEDLIFETKINKLQLEEKIRTQIHQYIDESADYDIQPVVEFGKSDGTNNIFALIDITINNNKALGVLVK